MAAVSSSRRDSASSSIKKVSLVNTFAAPFSGVLASTEVSAEDGVGDTGVSDRRACWLGRARSLAVDALTHAASICSFLLFSAAAASAFSAALGDDPRNESVDRGPASSSSSSRPSNGAPSEARAVLGWDRASSVLASTSFFWRASASASLAASFSRSSPSDSSLDPCTLARLASNSTTLASSESRSATSAVDASVSAAFSSSS